MLEALAQHPRSFTDEFGSHYLWLEGSHGGETVLIWLEEAGLEEVLRGLQGMCFKGRMVLGIHTLPGLAAPFARALYWANPRKALIIAEGEGIGIQSAGAKEVAEGVWVSWDDPRPGRLAHCTAPSGLEFAEPRTYVPWQHPLPLGTLPTMEGPLIGGQAGVLAYGLGRLSLGLHLRALLGAWWLLEG